MFRVVLMVSFWSLLISSSAVGQDGSLLIRNARIFDGEAIIQATDVLVIGEEIVEIGSGLIVPANGKVLDLEGGFLMPGMLDGHTHTFAAPMLDSCTLFGVTTVFDMFTSAEALKTMRASVQPGRCEIRSAGTLVTAPGGHGTQFGLPIPTITSPDEALAFIRERKKEGSDYIKAVYDNGRSMGFELPTLSKETLKAVVDAAHAEGLLCVVHIHDFQAALEAIQVGANGLVHTFVDELPDDRLAHACVANGSFMVPTLAVIESVCGIRGGDRLSRDERMDPYLTEVDQRGLRTGFPPGSGPKRDYEIAKASVIQLHEAGVPILAGTDAPNPGTIHGASMHRELELLVDAGLTPLEALASATSVPADAFGIQDRGRIKKGLRADLLCIKGDPSTDITDTREIIAVFQGGVRVDRDARKKVVAEERERRASGQLHTKVSTFDGGDLAVGFGQEWVVSTDSIAGGSSTGEIEVVEGGADGTSHAMKVTGEVKAGAQFAWSGAMFSPGSRPFAEVDLSHCRSISFWAKGDGKNYQLMFFSSSAGRMPIGRPFEAKAEWTHHVFELKSYEGVDPSGITGMLFSAFDPGKFEFQVDQVEFQ